MNYLFGSIFTVLVSSVLSQYQSGACREILALDCNRYTPIEKDESVCGTDGNRYNNYCEFSQAECKNPSLGIASLGHCGYATTQPITTGRTTTPKITNIRPITTPQTTRSTTTTPTKTSTPSTTTPSTTTPSTTTSSTTTPSTTTTPAVTVKPTRDPSLDLFCQNKDHITCPSKSDPVCGSNGIQYQNSCFFAKASCDDVYLSKAADPSRCA